MMRNHEKSALNFHEKTIRMVFVLAMTVVVMSSHLAAMFEGRSLALRHDKGRIKRWITSTKTDVDITPLSTSVRANDNTIDLIVSHCTEDLKWIEVLAQRVPLATIYIYEKCTNNLNAYRHANQALSNSTCEKELQAHDVFSLPCMQHLEVNVLPNTGREGATFLHHMLRRDITFSKWNIFLQGGFEAKGVDLERGLNATRSETGFDFIDLSKFRKGRNFRCYHWPFCPQHYFSVETLCDYHDRYKSSNSTCEEAHGSLRGEFIVTEDAIQRVFSSETRNKLTELLGILNKENSPKIGHFLERMWIEILNVTELVTHTKPHKSVKDVIY
jgi:hypothetical protein